MWRVSSGAASESALTLLLFFIYLPINIDFPFYLPVFLRCLYFFCFIIFTVITCSSLLSDRHRVKLDVVSGTGRSTQQLLTPG